MRFDYLIVGAGFTGSVLAERLAAELGKKVLVVDRRPTIGGNAYDYYNEHGILVHKYGPHIFHTNSEKVWLYLSRFTDWRPYFHHVLGLVDGKEVPIPFNLNTLDALFPAEQARRLQEELLAEYGFGAKIPILKMREGSSGELRQLAEFVYEKIFYGYTTKQWDLTPEQLSPSVTARVPVYISRDDRYFQDRFQAMPTEGYTALFERLLAHDGIQVLLETDYREIAQDVRFDRMIYTGAIDEFFDRVHGDLPYRSLRFEQETLDQEWYQAVGSVNYPNSEAYTRITEQKHLTGQQADRTTIVYEYPQAHVPGETEPYYPIPRDENRELFAKYEKEVAKLNGSVLFAGRLADYQYYNMDQAAARALAIFEKEIAGTG